MAEQTSREHNEGHRHRMAYKRRGKTDERRSMEDETKQTAAEDDGSETTHRPLWNPSAPHLKWKVFVRGKDFTLQGSGVCGEEEEEEEDKSMPAHHGEAARSFYESVVRHTSSEGHCSTDTHTLTQRHRRATERGRRNADLIIDRHADTHSDGYSHTHTHRQNTKERETHKNTDLARDRPTNTHTKVIERSSHTHTHREKDTRETDSNKHTDTHTQDTTSAQNPTRTHAHTHGPQHTHTAFWLAQNGDTTGLSAMLDEGLNVNTKDSYGWSLLMVAACAGAGNTVRTLLERGARTGFRDARGNTALYLATIKGHREVTEMLIKANKRTNKRTNGKTRDFSTDSSSGKEEEEEEEEGEYFCDTCKVAVKERQRVTHTASIIHQFKTTTRQTHTHYGIPPSNRGYQLLVGQGWDAEGGLGSEQQGHKFPVKTVLKRDRKGLGAGREMPKVTHFGPGDDEAVKRSCRGTGRIERIGTVSRREARQKKAKEKEEEIRLRRMLNEPDF